MALKISRLPKAPAITPRQHAINNMAAFIESEPVLAHALRNDHPLLAFEPIRLSESLSLRVNLRGTDRQVVGSVPVFDISGNSPEAINTHAFNLALRGLVQTLLFWHDTDLSRENLRLIDADGTIEWDAVVMYLQRALIGLPIATASGDWSDSELRVIADPATQGLFASSVLRINKTGLQAQYAPAVARLGHWRANEALKDNLLIQLTRLVLELMTPEQAEAQREAQQQAEAARAVLRSNAEAVAPTLRASAESLSKKLFEQLSVK